MEGMRPEVLLSALERAGATFEGEDAPAPAKEPLTRADLYELGLTGGPDSAEKRRTLMKKLALPEHLSTSAMMDALNLLYGRAELLALLDEEM